jgi:outer membrane protein OmpA-like peptidoglycan-associated protein
MDSNEIQEIQNEEENWLSIADMMSGLMLVFLLISISFLIEVKKKEKKLEIISEGFISVEKMINNALVLEFADEVDEWEMEILKDNTVRFNSPKVQFEPRSYRVNGYFQLVLEDFFPRYIKALSKFKEHIEEIRIEGHTSSIWNGKISKDGFILNSELSQKRAFKTLKFVFTLPNVSSYFDWLKQVLRSNGLSSSKTLDENGEYTAETGLPENGERSRRVDFRIMINSREVLRQMEETLNE